MIKLRDLQYLDAIAKYKHFGKAAEMCFVSQPTLSGQIMKLERYLGLTLIERQTRKVLLTTAGEQLVKQANIVLQAAENFESMAKALLDPLSGDLHIGLIPTLAPYLLPHIVPNLNRELPKVNFFLHEDKTQNLLKSLEVGVLDILILPWLEGMEKFQRYDLFDETFLLATPAHHTLSQHERVQLAHLASLSILTLEDGHCLRDQAMGYCFAAGATEDQSFRATSLETLRYMVASGVGVTLMPKLAILNREHESDVSYIPFTQPEPSRRIVLLTRKEYSRIECVNEIVSSVQRAMYGVFG